MSEPAHTGRISAFLSRASVPVFTAYAIGFAFTTYFCMYSFRKPWAAGLYAGQELGSIELKSALIISQLIGYATSKMLGIKVNSEMPPARRRNALILMILVAEAALLLFAVVPPNLKVVALFLNGLPLGMIWGLVFSFLEGRKTSEMLGAGLSCSYIVASGAVKSIGTVFLEHGVSESWMPVVTGACFLPLFVFGAWGLSQLPPPTRDDSDERMVRAQMYKTERRAFVKKFLFGVIVLCVVYLFLTAYRDVRDNFAADIWAELGYGKKPAVFTKSEIPVALAVMFFLGMIYLIKDNRWGVIATYAMMFVGSVLLGLSTLAFDAGLISGMTWMILVGTGLYMGYVPYGCVLFDRMIAMLGTVATAVFLIYVTDAVGYGGSIFVVLYKELGTPNVSMLDFFRYFSYATAVVTTIGFVVSGSYFLRRARTPGPTPS